MKHNLTFLSTLLATTILAGNALADIDCSQYNSDCNSGNGTCTCSQNDNGTVNLALVTSDGYNKHQYEYVYSENKQVLEKQESSYYKGTLERKTINKYTYDDLGRQIEGTTMKYAPGYGYIDDIEGYSKFSYHYDSDEATNYSSYDALNMYGASQYGGGSSINIDYNNQNIRISDAVALTNKNLKEVEKLVNEGGFDKLVAYTGGQLDYYRTMAPRTEGMPTNIQTNNLGFSYLPIEYDDYSIGKTVYKIPEMFVQNEDGSISVYDISAATANLSREELGTFIQNADPKNVTGATLKGKYDSVMQYMLRGVLGYNASGSGDEDDASALAEKYHGTPLLYGKKIYTVEEAMEATKDGTKFHVGLTYK